MFITTGFFIFVALAISCVGYDNTELSENGNFNQIKSNGAINKSGGCKQSQVSQIYL